MQSDTFIPLQKTFAPQSTCFGCGPANPLGLRINSQGSPNTPEVVAEWQASQHHEAFPGMLNGGIIGALLDCHSNWTAAYTLFKRQGATDPTLTTPPCTVTANFSVSLKRPTPTDSTLYLKAYPTEIKDDRVTVEATLSVKINGEEKVCATCTGLFVQVKPGHPAYHRW